MSMQEARPATPEEEARFRQLEHEEEARRLAQSRRQEVKGLAWSNDNSRLSRITEADGDEWLRLQFTETHEDKQGRTVFRQVECLVPCKFRVIG